ncbi:MAG: hypothetical protein CO029_04995 [Candidatus Magasanikbacteria bacterium CG_4_9_14_0_2_um_filter_41_10]|uniref:DUF302 domain-containing protein n=1 Tax=Candidatus Magasanikbacteria bacterium CG_4_10_14_0_2_um_filter_41_31 TaxID=1974639 RepID=A0A2M7V5N0_9BACT|nr:MAG: hypothetical protein AUJ37_02725 [Candidatus Magasanikbacteria bacterium CG1_02_41_34]PIZ93933.1 MAG: hypothetical protein COX83_00610 [Candidatus Magasanikbacteria bacterium CG_4_10_14_0_2_um_filter_41_31]PJC53030.1 MAG: hypothetical protein CO029_04995 [Candidatus Magasanikbacteria bacterium CG_4_9_14_0_2_um_filter_41_10]
MSYGFTTQVSGSFSSVIKKTKQALAAEGFGVLTEIDVKATLKEKLNVDFDNYVILGACNPPFAYKALLAEPEIGLFLPCNVIVYEQKGVVHVSAINPVVAMSMVESNDLEVVALQVSEKLKKTIDRIAE